MKSLVARAPTRIDFGGGWTDVPPYSDEEGGCVCNLAIAQHATVRLRRAANGDAPATVNTGHMGDGRMAEAALKRAGLHGVSIDLRCEFPFGAGLGGSSATGVAVSGAIRAWCGNGHELDRAQIAEQSRVLEIEDLGIAGGRQDHYASAYGGALELHFDETTRVRPIALSTAFREQLERRCIVAYTGQSRISGETITAVIDAYRARTPRVVRALARMKALAAQMADAVRSEAIDDLGELVGEHWVFQRALHPAIPTPLIDEILARGKMVGALGGKALGASGGGCVLLIARAENVDRVRNEVATLAELLPVQIDEGGFTWIAEE